jgi:hypothetical protein
MWSEPISVLVQKNRKERGGLQCGYFVPTPKFELGTSGTQV